MTRPLPLLAVLLAAAALSACMPTGGSTTGSQAIETPSVSGSNDVNSSGSDDI